MKKYILTMIVSAGIISGLASCARCAECIGGHENGEVFCKTRSNLDEKAHWEEKCIEKGGRVGLVR